MRLQRQTKGIPQGLKRLLKKCIAKQKRTSAAKAALQAKHLRTAEAVPLSKTGFFSTL
jgi:hypothetical protein